MTARRALAALALVTLAGACSKKPPPAVDRGAAAFPALPTTPSEVDALIARETQRAPPDPDPDLDASTILKAAEARGLGALPSGQAGIVRWIEAELHRAKGDAYLLFGTWHDAPGQIDAFRRLIGPGGLTGPLLVAVEQFRADGAWQGAPPEAQAGDGALLDAWSSRGDRGAFAALAEQHRESDYAAWKLGYEETALDMLVSARAAGNRVAGCDMPSRLQTLSGAKGEARNRLREIHCLRSLPVGSPRRVAMIWGEAHVRRSGIVRFLPGSATVLSIHVYGRRQVAGAVEIGLASRLTVNDPVLVPLREGECALILPDEALGGRVDRVLASSDEGGFVTGLTASAEIEGVLAVGDRKVPVGREPVTVPLAPGDYTYGFTAKGRSIVGALKLSPGHRVEVGFDPEGKATSYVERGGP